MDLKKHYSDMDPETMRALTVLCEIKAARYCDEHGVIWNDWAYTPQQRDEAKLEYDLRVHLGGTPCDDFLAHCEKMLWSLPTECPCLDDGDDELGDGYYPGHWQRVEVLELGAGGRRRAGEAVSNGLIILVLAVTIALILIAIVCFVVTTHHDMLDVARLA